MCQNCKGFGSKWHANWAIEYYGNGEEVNRKRVSELRGEQCRSCKGSGVKGGILREGEAPILDLLKPLAPREQAAENKKKAEESSDAPTDILPV